ncbi:MAG: type I pullulanase [Saprospirales bacterium]|nr:type I pullulanase [Saprospirales bacterium]
MKLKPVLSLILFAVFFFANSTTAQVKMAINHQPYRDDVFNAYPVYTGDDLGLTYSKKKSVFKIWSPPAMAARLLIYEKGVGGKPLMVKDMKRKKGGVWVAKIKGDLEGRFYTFQVKVDSIVKEKKEAPPAELTTDGAAEQPAASSEATWPPPVKKDTFWNAETPDPYARAVGVNGLRAMVVDLEKTNPPGWEKDQRPPLKGYNDIILYELHLRDFSVHPSSGIKYKGKFLSLTETGTKNPAGQATGIDHLKELGVTHVHLLPVFDFKSIDESIPNNTDYNWGYDPQNYNVPEGSYSTDPFDGRVRIKEFKEMVKALHDNGIRVIMDVVYNHTYSGKNSVFNLLVPYYYYRLTDDGYFSNASGCGNETASERPMMRKFMLESMKYWVEEYHIDGFRVDLMGIHDIETMNLISRELRKIDPTIFIYGEGWTAGSSPFDEQQRAVKTNAWKLDHIAVFSDEFRDGVKGHVFTPKAKGFASGEAGLEESVKFGIVGAIEHPQVDNKQVNYSKYPWAKSPLQCIDYVSCHDNHTLYDRLVNSCPGEPEEELLKMIKLAQTLVFTSQGVPFLHAGEEFVRSKKGVENSFDSPDEINQILWNNKQRYEELYDYHRKLIALRKAHPAFKMGDAEMVRQHLQFLDLPVENVIGYVLKDHANGDSWKNILLLFNGNKIGKRVEIPEGNWKYIVYKGNINPDGMGNVQGNYINLDGRAAVILAEE